MISWMVEEYPISTAIIAVVFIAVVVAILLRRKNLTSIEML